MLWQDVCLSQIGTGIMSKLLNVLSNFSPSGSHTILVFPYQTLQQYSKGDVHNTGSNAAGVWEKSQFSTKLSEMMQDRAVVTIEHQ